MRLIPEGELGLDGPLRRQREQAGSADGLGGARHGRRDLRPDLVAAAQAELRERVGGERIRVVPPGISEVTAQDPMAFWEARW